MSKLGFGIITWFELGCIFRRLMTAQLWSSVLTISLVCNISTNRCNLNWRRVCILEWVTDDVVVFLLILLCSECKSSSVGEFDQCILMHILPYLNLSISMILFIYFYILYFFSNLVYFCFNLIFVLYFQHLQLSWKHS